jgi:SpoVK/Ycf46/Vps4 family AAA+-type ATPase
MLSRLFSSVERGVGVLFFDEADALFGKRTEVKDSHDRYANLEISYLLQLLEEFDGLAILTTNLKRNIDDAFLRRLQFNINFPQPGEMERSDLWQLFLHEDLPQGDDIDVGFLARRFALSGASIRNVTLRAAFDAAHAETAVGMAQLLRAVQAEYRQLEQVFDPRLVREYDHVLVPPDSNVEVMS